MCTAPAWIAFPVKRKTAAAAVALFRPQRWAIQACRNAPIRAQPKKLAATRVRTARRRERRKNQVEDLPRDDGIDDRGSIGTGQELG